MLYLIWQSFTNGMKLANEKENCKTHICRYDYRKHKPDDCEVFIYNI